MKPKQLLILSAALLAALGLIWMATDRGDAPRDELDRGVVPSPGSTSSDAGLENFPEGATERATEPMEAAGLPPQGPAEGTGSTEGIARLIEYGRALGPELDFVKPWPDPAQLEKLRAITLVSGVSASELQQAAGALGANDPGRVALVAATAWAAEPDALTDQWLRGLAADWTEQGVIGEQGSLAAVLAMDLGGRTTALALAAEELMELSGGDEDSPSFAGLAGVRTWHALRGLERVDGAAWSARFERWFTQDTPERRVNEELWALAVRSSEDWRERTIQRANDVASGPVDQGVTAVTGGLESLPRSTSDVAARRIEQLAESERAGWISGAAAKSIAACGTEDSSRWLTARLRGGLIARDQALEALRTWRLPADPTSTLTRLGRMNTELRNDEGARAALSLGLQRAVDRLRFRRNSARRNDAAAALKAAAALLNQDDPWADQLAEWSRQLRGVN